MTFWGADSDRDWADEVHRFDGRSPDAEIARCRDCGAEATCSTSAGACCADCSQARVELGAEFDPRPLSVIQAHQRRQSA